MEWAIEQTALERMIEIVTRDPSLAELREKALAARDGQPLKNTRKVEMRDGVAVIPANGPMFRHAGMMEDLCGATSYETLRKDFQAAIDDPAVRAVLLNIDSPGGEVNGISELAQAIFAARGTKPIEAYVGGSASSAAYWLASATDRITVSPTAVLGSIGVIMGPYVDETKKDEAAGIKKISIVSSQSPNKMPDPATDDGRSVLQARVDDLAQVFIDTAAQYRAMDPEKLQKAAGNGGVRIGGKAVKAGLADATGNYEAVLAGMAERGRSNKGAMMDPKKMALALGLADTATEQEIEARAKSALKFEQTAIASLGAKDADEALGKMRAAAESLDELNRVRAERAAEQAAATQREFRAVLEQALAGDKPKLTLGQVAAVVPTFLEEAEEKKAVEAISKIGNQTAEEVIKAVCSAQATPRAISRIKSYIGASAPVIPTVKTEPELPETGKLSDESAEERAISEEFKRQRAVLDAQRSKK